MTETVGSQDVPDQTSKSNFRDVRRNTNASDSVSSHLKKAAVGAAGQNPRITRYSSAQTVDNKTMGASQAQKTGSSIDEIVN